MIEDLILVDDSKPCPFCGEIIKQVAIKCRFCGELIGDENFPGVFRQGKQVVMSKTATLPPWCVKSSEPAEHWLRRNFSWHHPLIYILILGGLLPYAIVAVATQKRAKLLVPLSAVQFRRRRRSILIAWLLIFGGIASLIAGPVISNRHNDVVVACLVFGGIAAIVSAIIYGMVASRLPSAARIDKTHIWLRGIHPDFVAALPEWPGEL